MTADKVLIIKTGRSETFGPIVGGDAVVSLGDVFSSTVILHPFKDYHVTWLTDEKAMPLLEANPHINRLLSYDLTSVLQLKGEAFDVVINFEKIPGMCALADSIETSVEYGFGFDPQAGKAVPCARNYEVLAPYMETWTSRKADRPGPAVLFEALGKVWKGEDYVLGYQPKILQENCDIGLNYLVGPRWPVKAWPQECFIELKTRLEASGYGVSAQRGTNDIREYIDWISSCRVVVTSDSLGMYLAVALGKKVVVLFGPTSPNRVHLYGKGVKLVAERFCDENMPCYSSVCPCRLTHRKESCMENISVEKVLEEVKKLLPEGGEP